MTDSNTEPGTRKSAWKGCFVLAGGVAVVLLAVPVVAYFIWSATASRRVASQLAEIRAKGEPTSASELDRYYTLPGGPDAKVEDTTQLVLAALPPLDAPQLHDDAQSLPVIGTDPDKKIPPVGQEWPEREALRQLLAGCEAPLAQLHEVADKGAAARFDLKFEESFNMLLEHLSLLRQAARLLKLEAHLRAHDGDLEGTVDSLTTGFQLANCLDEEPTIVSQLVNIALRSVALDSMQELAMQVDFSDKQLERLQNTIRQADFSRQMRSGLIGERALAIEAFRNPGVMAGDRTAQGVPLGPRNDDLSLYLELMTPLIDSLERQPWTVQRAEAKKSVQELQNRTSGSISRLRYILTGLLFPAMESALDAQARAAARRDLVDCLLAARRYQLAHGRLPPQLADLVPDYLPAVPPDPFDGQPLRYLVDEQGVRIYSIGRDEQDDGGQGDETLAPDIVVRLPRAGSGSN